MLSKDMVSYPLYNTSKIIVNDYSDDFYAECELKGSLHDCNFFRYRKNKSIIKFENNDEVDLTFNHIKNKKDVLDVKHLYLDHFNQFLDNIDINVPHLYLNNFFSRLTKNTRSYFKNLIIFLKKNIINKIYINNIIPEKWIFLIVKNFEN